MLEGIRQGMSLRLEYELGAVRWGSGPQIPRQSIPVQFLQCRRREKGLICYHHSRIWSQEGEWGTGYSFLTLLFIYILFVPFPNSGCAGSLCQESGQ